MGLGQAAAAWELDPVLRSMVRFRWLALHRRYGLTATVLQVSPGRYPLLLQSSQTGDQALLGLSSRLTSAAMNSVAGLPDTLRNLSAAGVTLDGYTRSGGTIESLAKSFDRRLRDLQNYKATLSQMIQVRENNLRREFQAMEQAVSTLRSQGSWFAAQLGQLSAFSGGGNI